jgi:hypothetical protein
VITVDLLCCCAFQQHLCQLPEGGSCAELYRSKLIVKYIIYRTVRFLVLIEFDESMVKRCGVNRL